jgi:hypothetical protein
VVEGFWVPQRDHRAELHVAASQMVEVIATSAETEVDLWPISLLSSNGHAACSLHEGEATHEEPGRTHG